MEQDYFLKNFRVLKMYNDLLNGKIIRKKDLANSFGVHERSIQRDIENLKDFLYDLQIQEGYINNLIYSRRLGGYYLESHNKAILSNDEILAVCKILLESRAFVREDIMPIIDTLLKCCVSTKDYQTVSNVIASEKFHYIEPHHKDRFIGKLWEISNAIAQKKLVRVHYTKIVNSVEENVEITLKPVGILFSEYYFYVTAYVKGEELLYPASFRIDRIKEFKVLEEGFTVPYANRFEDGEFRKRIQFMKKGNLQTIEFKFWGMSVEAILDRLPTAEIVKEENGVYTISAEIFGSGVLMWLLSQGDKVEITKPESYRQEMKAIVENLHNMYK